MEKTVDYLAYDLLKVSISVQYSSSILIFNLDNFWIPRSTQSLHNFENPLKISKKARLLPNYEVYVAY